ncbi:fragile histidine triad protein [Gilbertella persicaria]|uniref:fragile histidine triad protein n=1 Tax=Gilbertella persicaria TaxID=101096 RepID=UPI002220957B|nr:fragile histidine triad protein [Gilbertella persicaria]KAI8069746.1 fragile histidine triad protein [Gilbertella persicaria]
MTVYRFGPHIIHESQIFFKSKLALGIVNLKPIAPGHVLVIPRRVAARLADLDVEETVDLMMSAQSIGNVVEKHYQGTSLTLTIQDGPQAGQTVPHVHMHIIPRKKGDWANNDDIYHALDSKVDNEGRKPRTEQEMKEEADALRVYFMN